MKKDIELLTELKGQFVEKMVAISNRPLLDGNAITKCGEYIGALSNAIVMMKEAENDDQRCPIHTET
ncbi:hypothetical protein ACTGYP_04135 [Streptococcus suis]